MLNTYFNMPLNLKEITQQVDAPKISLKQSIHNMIHLISTSCFGELKHDYDFGCEIWMHDFINIYNVNNFKESLRKSIKNSIEKNEKRISNVNVNFQIEQVELRVKNRRTKVRISLFVSGIINKTNEPLKHQEMFFIGPLSYY